MWTPVTLHRLYLGIADGVSRCVGSGRAGTQLLYTSYVPVELVYISYLPVESLYISYLLVEFLYISYLPVELLYISYLPVELSYISYLPVKLLEDLSDVLTRHPQPGAARLGIPTFQLSIDKNFSRQHQRLKRAWVISA